MAKRRLSRALPDRRITGQALRNAQKLFALPEGRKMESPDQREEIAGLLLLSGDEILVGLAQEALLKPPARQASESFVHLMERNRVNLFMVQRALNKVWNAQGFIAQGRRLPWLMEQAAIDAESKWEPCEKCEGKGSVKGKDDEAKPCDKCAGKGEVYKLGDIERLRLVFETQGLRGKAGAGMQGLDITNPPGAHESLHELSGSLAGILEGEVKP